MSAYFLCETNAGDNTYDIGNDVIFGIIKIHIIIYLAMVNIVDVDYVQRCLNNSFGNCNIMYHN